MKYVIPAPSVAISFNGAKTGRSVSGVFALPSDACLRKSPNEGPPLSILVFVEKHKVTRCVQEGLNLLFPMHLVKKLSVFATGHFNLKQWLDLRCNMSLSLVALSLASKIEEIQNLSL